MDNQNNLNAIADYYVLKKALLWAAERLQLSNTVLKRVDVLNAQSCGLSAEHLCRVLV